MACNKSEGNNHSKVSHSLEMYRKNIFSYYLPYKSWDYRLLSICAYFSNKYRFQIISLASGKKILFPRVQQTYQLWRFLTFECTFVGRFSGFPFSFIPHKTKYWQEKQFRIFHTKNDRKQKYSNFFLTPAPLKSQKEILSWGKSLRHSDFRAST